MKQGAQVTFTTLVNGAARKFPALRETGSQQTAASTTQSHANRDFPWFDEYPRFCGAQSRLAVSAGKKDRFRGSSGPSVSGNPKTVSRSVGRSGQRLGSHATETGLRSRYQPTVCGPRRTRKQTSRCLRNSESSQL